MTNNIQYLHDKEKYNLNEKSILNNIEDLLKNETK